MKGLFITFEGIDGSGKSTQAILLKNRFSQMHYPVVLTKEPGGTALGEKIRKILLNEDMNPLSEFLLFASDRREHIEKVIRPSLLDGKIVISDRFTDSSLVYQGFGRGVSLNFIKQVHQYILEGLKPDLTFVIDVPIAVGIERIHKKDRIEKEGIDFLKRIRKGYIEISKLDERFVMVNGTDAPEKLNDFIWKVVLRRLENG